MAIDINKILNDERLINALAEKVYEKIKEDVIAKSISSLDDKVEKIRLEVENLRKEEAERWKRHDEEWEKFKKEEAERWKRHDETWERFLKEEAERWKKHDEELQALKEIAERIARTVEKLTLKIEVGEGIFRYKDIHDNRIQS